MNVAEAMGRSLQQTSISTNIKERLDYSCALFSHTGDLVANAPFIPVHLGSMSFAVKFQLDRWKGDLKAGDVLLANSPIAGGSHLPDLTVITPIFDPTPGKEGDIIFFTASRAHHSDIGGITGGSMPATSTLLAEEGAEIVSFKLVSGGKLDVKGLYRPLVEEPAKFPGGSGCRNYRDVESDIKAVSHSQSTGMSLTSSKLPPTTRALSSFTRLWASTPCLSYTATCHTSSSKSVDW
jgi:5-oxoprolinase (ATP-hydrolysing)